MPLTHASGNFTASGVELEPNEEDADVAEGELDEDDTPDEEESDAAILPDAPA